jgi:hypothetical protein
MSAPACFTVVELKKVDVEIVDPFAVLLKCWKCGFEWSPPRRRGGRLPRGYWNCPNGCNRSKESPIWARWSER